jgi:hypothetical protein
MTFLNALIFTIFEVFRDSFTGVDTSVIIIASVGEQAFITDGQPSTT